MEDRPFRGTDPAGPQGDVTLNGYFDEDALLSRKENAGNSYWTGDTINDTTLSAHPGTMAFIQKSATIASAKKRKRSQTAVPFVTSFNGVASSDTLIEDIIEDWQFAGLVKAEGNKLDSTGANPTPDEGALRAGGVDTIRNEGNQTIANGDLLYWDLPNKERKDVTFNIRDGGQIRAVARPYDSSVHNVTANKVYEALGKELKDDPNVSMVSITAATIIGEALYGLHCIASGKEEEKDANDRMKTANKFLNTLKTKENGNRTKRYIRQLLHGVMKSGDFIKRRIFARAITTAAPGQTFDLKLGDGYRA